MGVRTYGITLKGRVSVQKAVLAYYEAVCERARLGNIESSYNQPIADLIMALGCQARDLSGARSGVSGANTDIQLWHLGEDTNTTPAFAGIEVKKVGGIDKRAKNQALEETKLLGNVIMTDNLVWWFYHIENEEPKSYTGVQLIEEKNGKLSLCKVNVDLFISLVQDFLLQSPSLIRSSSKLAEYMAIHAKTIRSVILGILKEDENKQPLVDERQKRLPLFRAMFGLYSKIKEELRPAITSRDFADMYAQTIVYGLFIARYNDSTPTNFDRYEAIGNLRQESNLLKLFFSHITSAGDEDHPTLKAVINKLCDLYRICDLTALLNRDESKDTIVHFYEEFLTFYDPAQRKAMGVFYTPWQVVRYLVSMVDKILVEDFGITAGLSDNSTTNITVKTTPHPVEKWINRKKQYVTVTESTRTVPKVAILDPACGTGTFHAEIIKYVKEKYFSGSKAIFYRDYIQRGDGLLSRLIAFEIMMTSYVVAHLKIRRTIQETLGGAPDRVLPTRIYLTNTLSEAQSEIEHADQMSFLDFSGAITEETRQADNWKTRRPIKVIIGNPPWLAEPQNKYDVTAYKTETDGVTPFGERKHLLNDYYVQFFRFSQEIIDKNKEGIIAFVSNNGYLDNPTFRGMRASLLRSFDRIHIVNLHGSITRKEISPDGGVDNNIFDIQQGVALFIGVKTTVKTEWARIFYADIWGIRIQKFEQLLHNDVSFVELSIDPEMAYFVPISQEKNDNKPSYDNGVSISELFLRYNSGIYTRNDQLCIQTTNDEMNDIVNSFITYDVEQLRQMYNLGIDKDNWKVCDAKSDIMLMDGSSVQIAFRPFDSRWTYFTGRSGGFISRPCGDIMSHIFTDESTPVGKNIALVFTRGDSTPRQYSMVFVSDTIVDNRITAAQTAGAAYTAPLYLLNRMTNKWEPNFSPNELTKLTEHMSNKPEPIEIFDYVYGVLHDPVYRERFGEFLKRDYPRVPIVNNLADKENRDAFFVSEECFHEYVSAGKRLRNLHLLHGTEEASLTVEPQHGGNMVIEKTQYKDGLLYINKTKRISGISVAVWQFVIGGYQVLDKWFKSHKGETFDYEQFGHICKVVSSLQGTIDIQTQLRQIHTKVEDNGIVFVHQGE